MWNSFIVIICYSQLKCALTLKKPNKELISIYVSLAATYADNKQYEKAIQMYHKELELRAGNRKEVSSGNTVSRQ